jgi:DnaK suppressor protein
MDFLDTIRERAYNQRFVVRVLTRLWDPAMDKKRLENYKKKLQAKREELVRNIARVEAEGRAADEDTTVDLADKAANSYTKEFLFGQTNAERAFLHLVEEALKRIGTGKFGECANCEDEINQKRLDAVPWAKYCIDCQEKQEHGQL